MKEEILITGHGGQGIVVAGNIIANAAMESNLETCAMFSYGVEMRGGTTNSTVIISENKIGSPVVVNPTIAVIMNQKSLEKFEENIKKNGLIILNKSECEKKVSREDVKVIEVETTTLTEKLGNKKAANLIMLGVLVKKTGLLKREYMEKAIEKVFSEKKHELIEINKKAFNEGYNLKGD